MRRRRSPLILERGGLAALFDQFLDEVSVNELVANELFQFFAASPTHVTTVPLQVHRCWASRYPDPVTSGSPQSLSGIRVADFSRVLAGPYATMMLADLGADVIKVESPAGDDTRAWKPPVDAAGRSIYFASVNRNKRAVTLDLRDEEQRATARELAVTADVVVENFKPGGMASFGLDYEAIAAENPGVVYCSITGFGEGEGAALPGYDLLVQAVGGLMSVTGQADGEPTKAGVALVDVLTGMNAVIGIQAALRSRELNGRGQRVQVNLLQSLLSALVNQASGTLATGTPPGRMGNAHPSISPYETYCAADRPMVIAVGNDRQFAAMARVLGDESLPVDARFLHNGDRVAHREELKARIEAALSARPAAEWVDELLAAGVPAGRVNDVGEAIALADSLGLGPVVSVGDGIRLVANPIRLSETPPTYRLPPPEQSTSARIAWLPKEN